MGRVNHYLLRHFSALFASLFFTLFFITSVVFFIKIASITSVIKINFYELIVLYIFLLPNILLYTLPVTFFIALCLSLYNLSKENETIVLFTLGHKPQKISKLFVSVASILSFLLFIDILVLIPTAKQLNANFIDHKRMEAKFNIKATEFGQKFSDWLVYINKSDEKNTYNDIVMYQNSQEKNTQKFITAKSAQIKNNKGNLRLNLDDGKAFEITQTDINQINFQKMYIRSDLNGRISKVVDIVSYWKEALKSKKRAYDLAFFLIIALFPIATVLFAISIGVVTYRYEKRGVYLPMTMVIVFYLIPGVLLVQYFHLLAALFVFLISLILSYGYYRKKILLRY